MKHLELIFQILQNNHLAIILDKCEFQISILAFLGHIISWEGVQPDLEKLDAIVRWLLPTNIKGLKGFLGLTRYY